MSKTKNSPKKFYQKTWFHLIVISYIIYAIFSKKVNNSDTLLSKSDSLSQQISDTSETVKKQKTVEELILNEADLGNVKLDKKFSGKSSNGLQHTYIKKINNEIERSIILELYQFDDSVSTQSKFSEDMETYFSRTRTNEDGEQETNPFYSKRISVEKIGDKSFCYRFVSPTIEVLYKNYIITCNVTNDYVNLNLSENNSSTLRKSKEIIKLQIEKINRETSNL
jgi:hypothetical protein